MLLLSCVRLAHGGDIDILLYARNGAIFDRLDVRPVGARLFVRRFDVIHETPQHNYSVVYAR